MYGYASLLVSVFDSSGRKQAAIAAAWSRVLLAVSGVKVKVEGLEKISASGSYIFVANHLSYMDTPVVLANIPVQFRFLAKRGLFQIPFLGWHLSRAGHISRSTGRCQSGGEDHVSRGEIIRERGVSLLIFPEGGRSRRRNAGRI